MRQLSQLRVKIADRFGLAVERDGKNGLDPALREVAQARRESRGSIVDQAMYDPRLLREIAGALTVGESYFFRHPEHLAAILRLARDRLAQAPRRNVRIWSAGCSAGQEPYSIAMLLREQLPPHDRKRVELIATDIDGDAIATARAGRYGRWAMRATSPSRRARFFQAEDDRTFLLDREVLASVSFEHLSLQEHLRRMEPRRLDCILFRNVGIYLNERALEEIYRGFRRALCDGGLLLVAPADPRPGGTAFRLRGDGGSTTYERVPDTAPLLTEPASRREPAKSPAVPAPLPANTWSNAPKPSRQPSPLKPWDAAQLLADRGEYVRALSLCSEALELRPDDREGYALRGIIALSAGDAERAIEDLRRALFLDPTDSQTRYWFAISLNAANRLREARRQIRQLLEALQQGCDRGDPGQAELLKAALTLQESL